MRINTSGEKHGIPILIILFALLFLLRSLGYIEAPTVSVMWPILVGLGGIALLNQK